MFMGLRGCEIVRLRREDFSSDFREVTYDRAKRKTKKAHTRQVPDFLARDLAKYYARQYNYISCCGWFFPAVLNKKCKHKHLSRTTINYYFGWMRQELNIGRIYHYRSDGKPLWDPSPHCWRHYVSLKMYEATGKDIVQTSKIIGHANPKVTAHYVYSQEKRKVERHAADTMWKKK